MPRAESSSIETVPPIAERPSVVRKHRSESRQSRGPLPREDSSAGFVVEWQLQPLGEPEAGQQDTPVRLAELGA